jgi:prephenate dehydrogenase
VKRDVDVIVIGLGLIGGSLARALTRAGATVFGVDRKSVLQAARRQGAIAAGAEDPVQAPPAGLIVLGAPPRTNVALLRRLAGHVGRDTVITDLGSVKVTICAAARERGLSSFVGGHPMAGSERSGFGASRPDLFEGHPWIVTPDGAPRRAVGVVRDMVRAVGARPYTMTPDEHDRAVAFVSHMPQIAAWAIAHAAGADGVARKHLGLAGPGFRDMTRLARSPRPLWRMILEENRSEVARALAALHRSLRRPV